MITAKSRKKTAIICAWSWRTAAAAGPAPSGSISRYKNEKTKHLVPYDFTYGYAITCHKSQGSQWPKVLGVEEKFPFDKTEHARWLYTAATRASDKLVIVKKD